MSLLQWLGRKIGLRDHSFWSAFAGAQSVSGRTVTIEGAMKLSAWWGCVRIISETIATLPISVYQKTDDGKIERRDHPMFGLLHDAPNATQTAVEFWEGQVAPIAINGNSFAEKKFSNGRLIALEPIPFTQAVVRRTKTGELRYRYTDAQGDQRDVTADEIFHIRGFGAGGDMGLSPVSYARDSLGGAMAVEEASSRTFDSGMRASGFLLSPQVLDKEQRQQARKNLIEPLEGAEAEGKVGLLEGGWKWQPTNIPPKDAEMIMSRRFSIEDICRWMGVPPILVGHAAEGQTMWGSGVEQIMLGWLTLGLRAYIRRIEAAINRRLFTAAERAQGMYAEFNLDGLVRADSASRAQLMSALAQNGLRTRNELRALDNMPPMEGGDDLTVQSNLVPVAQLGQTQQVMAAYLEGRKPVDRGELVEIPNVLPGDRI